MQNPPNLLPSPFPALDLQTPLPQQPCSLLETSFIPSSPKNKPKQKLEKGKWNDSQNIKYLAFLRQKLTLFLTVQTRRRAKIFNLLSSVITSRCASQCRSHHQKMIKRHSTIPNIISYLSHQLFLKSQLFQFEELKIVESQPFETQLKQLSVQENIQKQIQEIRREDGEGVELDQNDWANDFHKLTEELKQTDVELVSTDDFLNFDDGCGWRLQDIM